MPKSISDKVGKMLRVLFVDDEPQILRGIQRLTSELDGSWDWAFASSGNEALAVLNKEKADIVVSDLRMPLLSGADLLAKVQQRWPATVRIVLSGQSDQTTVLKTVTAAHQFLAKPCGADDLIACLRRAETMHGLLRDENLRAAVSKLPNLPSAPANYDELVQELTNSETSMKRVCQTISNDIAMTAKVLQLVNSAFFGLPRQVSEVGQAAAILGTDVLRALVLNLEAFSKFPALECNAFSSVDIQRHSVAVSKLARSIGRSEGMAPEPLAILSTAAMLHDIGKLVLASGDPKLWQRIVKASGDSSSTRIGELALIKTTHAEIGGFLLGLWGLPKMVVEAITNHHKPDWNDLSSHNLAPMLYIANLAIHQQSLSLANLEAVLQSDELADVNNERREQITKWWSVCQNENDMAA